MIPESHPYMGNLNSEMSGDSTNVFLRFGDVFSVNGRPIAAVVSVSASKHAMQLIGRMSFNAPI